MKIRHAHLKDRRRHLHLLRSLFDSLPYSEKRFAHRALSALWEWKYRSPWRKSGKELTILLAFSGNEVAGAISYLPILMKVGKKHLGASWFQDLVVHPSYRKNLSGLANQLLREANRLTGPRLALGNHPVVQKIFLRRFSWKERKGVEFWGCPISDRRAGLNLPYDEREKLKNFRISPIENFPRDTDGLYERISEGYDVLVRRDSEYLNWRYCKIPLSPNPYLKFVIWRGRKIEGVLVLRVSARQADTGVIKEIFIEKEDDPLLAFCIRQARQIFRRQGVRFIKVLLEDQNSEWVGRFRKEGFFPLFESPGLTYCFPASPPASENALGGKWHVSSGDSDLNLIFE